MDRKPLQERYSSHWSSSGPALICPCPFCAGGPVLTAGLQVGFHESRAEEDHFTDPAGHIAFDTAQDKADFLVCEHTLLAHVEHLINEHPQVLLIRADLNYVFLFF